MAPVAEVAQQPWQHGNAVEIRLKNGHSVSASKLAIILDGIDMTKLERVLRYERTGGRRRRELVVGYLLGKS